MTDGHSLRDEFVSSEATPYTHATNSDDSIALGATK